MRIILRHCIRDLIRNSYRQGLCFNEKKMYSEAKKSLTKAQNIEPGIRYDII